MVGAENGIVNSSTVTATGSASGYAQFQLSVPSANLAQTMAALSRLRVRARSVSRTDATQDVNGQYRRRPAAGWPTPGRCAPRCSSSSRTRPRQTQIDSLKAQIRDAEASISQRPGDAAALNHQVNYSQISVTINARVVPPAHPVAAAARSRSARRPTTPAAC